MSRLGRLLNSSVEVWRTTRVADGGGGWETSLTQVGSERARLSQPSARERVMADQAMARLTHVVYLSDTADVRRGDELRQGTRSFEVLAVFEPSMPGTYLRANCEVHQPE